MIFKRNSEADNTLFLFFNKVGWAVLLYNGYTLYPYFFDLLKRATYCYSINRSFFRDDFVSAIRHKEVA